MSSKILVKFNYSNLRNLPRKPRVVLDRKGLVLARRCVGKLTLVNYYGLNHKKGHLFLRFHDSVAAEASSQPA